MDWIALRNQVFGGMTITFSEPSDRDFSAMEPSMTFCAGEQRDMSLIHLSEQGSIWESTGKYEKLKTNVHVRVGRRT